MTDQSLVSLVWDRANRTCEYCQLPQSFSSIPFEIDHIIAQKHGGPSEAANLALSCFYCNSYKGPNIAGFHPGSGRVLRLYHPRKDRWESSGSPHPRGDQGQNRCKLRPEPRRDRAQRRAPLHGMRDVYGATGAERP